MAMTAPQAVFPLVTLPSGPLSDDDLAAIRRLALAGDIAVTGGSPAARLEALAAFRCRLHIAADHSVEECIQLLNKGALKLVLPQSVAPAVLAELPRERVAVAVQAGDVAAAAAAAKHAGEIVVVGAAAVDVAGLSALQAALPAGTVVTHSGGVSTAADLVALDKLCIAAELPRDVLEGSLPLANALTAAMTSDRPDGLWTTVVTNEVGQALGVCYSNKESVAAAVERQQGVYWSRKRGLWVKGLTSGATQTLLGIKCDCDRDALLFVVSQAGDGFCHRDILSCFGPARGITRLMQTVNSRRESAPAGSYTKRLFDDAGFLKSKLIEEAIELSEAKTKDHVAAEAADVLYLAAVAMARNGVSVADVERILDQRHLKVTRRPGNAKPDFIKKHMKTTSAPEAKPAAKPAAPAPAPECPMINGQPVLKMLRAGDIPPLHRDPVNAKARKIAEDILADIRTNGEKALLATSVRLGDIKAGEPHIVRPAQMKAAFDSLSRADQAMLQRTADRIRQFAQMQLDSVRKDATLAIAGGEAGQDVAAVEVAGCYAPGGRYPLPSSVLMGALTAKVAGVKRVWVASPRPHPSVLAAAHVAGADGLLAVGGAQAIAAMAYGAGEVPICDAIVGPGNMFVTAAKSLVAGAVAIDMLAGPSECLVIADKSADPGVVAADLLAQSEHDTAARAVLVSPNQDFIGAVNAEIAKQLAVLPTADTARVAIERNSFAVHTANLDEAIDISNRVAPEHLEVHVKDPQSITSRLDHFGALFVGQGSAEVLGDYGAGPNHTLPTGGTARSFGGLSVHTFLRMRTWLRVDDLQKARVMVQDAVDLARVEGLHGHAHAAELRLPGYQASRPAAAVAPAASVAPFAVSAAPVASVAPAASVAPVAASPEAAGHLSARRPATSSSIFGPASPQPFRTGKGVASRPQTASSSLFGSEAPPPAAAPVAVAAAPTPAVAPTPSVAPGACPAFRAKRDQGPLRKYCANCGKHADECSASK